MLNNELLTMIYNSSNGIVDGKNPPISTEKIFNAMRLSAKMSLAEALNSLELVQSDKNFKLVEFLKDKYSN